MTATQGSASAARAAGRVMAAHLPAFGLQALARRAPERRQEALALEGEGRLRGRVAEVSRRAREAGVTEGQTLAQARAACPELLVLQPDPGTLAEARQAVHEALLHASPRVEWSGGGTFCAEATGLVALHGSEPALLAHAVALLREAGFAARAACASSRLVASVAARTRPGPCVVPAGHEAAFLAPLPLDALPLGPEALRRFELLGVRTLGQFARLPADGLADRFGRDVARWQRLARGEDPRPLLPLADGRGPRVVRELEAPVEGLEAVAFLLKDCCEELADELERRGTLAKRLRLQVAFDDPPGGGDERVLEPARPLGGARALLSLCRLEVEERRLAAAPCGLAISVLEEVTARAASAELFGASLDPEALAGALDRVRGLVGAQDVVAPESRDAHRREAQVGWAPFRLADERPARRRRGEPAPAGCVQVPEGDGAAELQPEAPLPVAVRLPAEGRPGVMHASAAARAVLGLPDRVELRAARGPLRLMGEWWDGGADVDRDEWLLLAADGGAYRAFRDRRTREWWLSGVVD